MEVCFYVPQSSVEQKSPSWYLCLKKPVKQNANLSPEEIITLILLIAEVVC